MATVADAISVLNTITGKSVDSALALRVGNQFAKYAGADMVAVDPQNPTNDELATNFLAMLRRFGESVVRGEAERTELGNQTGAVQAAGDAAAADLSEA